METLNQETFENEALTALVIRELPITFDEIDNGYRTYLPNGIYYEDPTLEGNVGNNGFSILFVQVSSDKKSVQVFVSDDYDEHQYFIDFKDLSFYIKQTIAMCVSSTFRNLVQRTRFDND